jgi:Fe-S-cluster containining protein
MEKLIALYEGLDLMNFMSGYCECRTCPMRCKREPYVHWLLPEEVESLSGTGQDIYQITISGRPNIKAFFFRGGLCEFFTGEHDGCGIYKSRPLECRLNPISIYKSRFIVYRECPVLLNHPHEFVQNIQMIIPQLNIPLKPWYSYFAHLSLVLPFVEPMIDQKIIEIGAFGND